MFSPTSLNDEDQNVGLTEEELAELEAELDADLDGSDSDSDGHSWDALEEKLKTALHESEPTQQSSSALSNLAGFEQFAKSSTAMGEQMQQYSSDLAAMKESGGVAAASMLSSNGGRLRARAGRGDEGSGGLPACGDRGKAHQGG